MSDILDLEISGDHQCYEIQTDRSKLLQFMQKDLENIEWAHLIPQRISDKLLLRAVQEFGASHIEKVGFPKLGILCCISYE